MEGKLVIALVSGVALVLATGTTTQAFAKPTDRFGGPLLDVNPGGKGGYNGGANGVSGGSQNNNDNNNGNSGHTPNGQNSHNCCGHNHQLVY